MVGHNAPPTPPLTESDGQQLLARQDAASSNTPNSLGETSATIFTDIFPTISNLAIQNRLSDLIDLAETTDLTINAQSRGVHSRFLLIVPLVLSYIMNNDAAAAHIALLRLPLNLSSQALAQSLLKLIAASSYGNYPLVYKSAEELLDLAKDNSINASLANVIKPLVDRYLVAFHHRTAKLLSKAYTSIPIALAQSYLNASEASVRKSLEAIGWTFNPATSQLFPPRAAGASPDFRRATSTLLTVKQMIDGAAQIESSV